jgi:hypothetical protein
MGMIAAPRTAALVALLTFFSAVYAQTDKPDDKSRQSAAEWTIMVYMDGDNNLEEDALIDFLEMSRVGSTDQVNIIVQLDRIGTYVPNTSKRFDFWTETLRFRVTKGSKPSPKNTPYNIGEANMGDGATLEDFVSWTKKEFPAKRYALIIWDHGQGWRGILPPTDEVRALVSKGGIDPLSQNRVGKLRLAFPFRTPIGSPYRTLSFDETDKDKLYNSEMAQALQKALKNEKLDLIGLDACLMAMLETAYALRGVASVFIGSEDLVPGTGWQYDDWLETLTNKPTMNAQALGTVLVESFTKRYETATEYSEQNATTTISAIDLSKVDRLADAVTALAKILKIKFNAEKQNIKTARDECSVYAPDALGDGRDYFLHIDLARFCERLLAHTRDQEIKNRLATVLQLIKISVLSNHAGQLRQGAFGSHGLAIYFPPNGISYEQDWLAEHGYENSRTRPAGQAAAAFPVEFVERHYWSDFLHVYFQHFVN